MTLYQVPGYGFPSLHAESFQTARMAAAFVACGLDARVVYPRSAGSVRWRDVRDTYGLSQPLRRIVLPAVAPIDVRGVRRLGDVLRAASLSALAMATGGEGVYLSRHPRYAPLATLLSLKARGVFKGRAYVELHEAQHFEPSVDSSIGGYIVVNERLRDFLADAGVAGERILVAPNAVDLDRYERVRQQDRESLRLELGLPTDRRLVCYTGQLGPGRNVEALIAALSEVDESAVLVIAGGAKPGDLERIQSRAALAQVASRVMFLGQLSARETARCQVAADVLVVPYTSALRHADACSPLKLWEYRATGNPIAAFRLPAFSTVLPDDEATWAADETPGGLAEAVNRALQESPTPMAAVRARLGTHTWRERAGRLAAFMGVASSPAPVREAAAAMELRP